MLTERARFLTLFDALFEANTAWMKGTPKSKWQWVPVENPNMKFGDRISTINIKSVYIHTIVGEVAWAEMLANCADSAVLKMNGEKIQQWTAQLNDSPDLVAEAVKLHAANMKAFEGYTVETLAKKIQWSGRDWTVMGFLWGIYSHRSYHLGNIDILMREADEAAPDFFSNFRQQMA
jgi:uncharacterized damage-inducible protein DinB